ncbi:Plasmid stabilization system protein [Pirellulimonas nuda]|uniref:Plasmid stabilization system protein n=1 Tax=Pirellulimonas nuda TaxID=2528009 RepID=A0A518DJZ5_9BACT|nr:type II toxin-antitoxin system RelE/ParE family toxin [Pirellulimonas nuda]QDU91772.1 Plasmid stabilization system protein [Pirellulimonas nuda]
MIRYRVVVTPIAVDKIAEYAAYIAQQAGSIEVATRWSDRVHAKLSTLCTFPARHGLAEEDAHRGYTIRRQIVGKHLALYTVDEVSRTVYVVGFRHGHMLPRPDELPESPR